MMGKIVALMTSILAVGVVTVWGESYLNQHQKSKWYNEPVQSARLNLLSASTTETYSDTAPVVTTPSVTPSTASSSGVGTVVGGNGSTTTPGPSTNNGFPVIGQVDSAQVTTGAYNGKNGVLIVQANIMNNSKTPLTYDNTNKPKLMIWLNVNGTVFPYSAQAAQGYVLNDTPSQTIQPGQTITVTLHFLTGLPPATLQTEPDTVHIGLVGTDYALEMQVTNNGQ